MEDVSLQQAYEILHHYLVEQDGLMYRIEQGLPFDKSILVQLEQAFKKIQNAWKQQSEIPKRVAYMLSSVLPRLDTYMQQHPEKIELGEVFM
ncbi:hypothetical protein, partial [Dictyobacter arantiisoli]